jgi:hypothetical protein
LQNPFVLQLPVNGATQIVAALSTVHGIVQ